MQVSTLVSDTPLPLFIGGDTRIEIIAQASLISYSFHCSSFSSVVCTLIFPIPVNREFKNVHLQIDKLLQVEVQPTQSDNKRHK